MDEIDAIGGRRFSEGTSADREIQRTLMELLNQVWHSSILPSCNALIFTLYETRIAILQTFRGCWQL